MAEIRVAAVEQGGMVDTPVGWSVFDSDTAELLRFEKNPEYVSPPPLTAIEQAEYDVLCLRRDLADAEADLAYLLGEAA